MLEAQRQIKTLRSITRLDPRAVKEAIERHLEGLEAQGRTKSATVSPATIHSCAQRIDQSLADWREIGDGEELAERLGAPLKPLRALRKRRAWGQAEIRQVADAAAAPRDRFIGSRAPVTNLLRNGHPPSELFAPILPRNPHRA